MKFTLAPLSLLALLPTLVSSVVVPGASTPEFYLVSASNLLPVLMTGALGSPGASPAAKFYFSGGSLLLVNPTPGGTPYNAFIDELPELCQLYGALNFQQGTSTTNKCAQFNTFSLQSDNENSQLGAQLVFSSGGNSGLFYVCAGDAVYWKNSPSLGPSGCNPVSLYTVPVV